MKYLHLLRRFLGGFIDALIMGIIYYYFVGFCVIWYGATGAGNGGLVGKYGECFVKFSTGFFKIPVTDSYFNFYKEDAVVIISFILLNVIYFGIGYKLHSASLGKRILKGKLFNTNNTQPTKLDFRRRLMLLASLMVAAWALHFFVSYPVAILVYFLAMNVPILFKKISLLDYLSHSTYIKRAKKILRT